MIQPFDEAELRAADADDVGCMKHFNQTLSSVRIASEHAFGILKGQFLSLKEMGRHRNVQGIYKVIEALMVLHNICLIWNDEPTYQWYYYQLGPDDEDGDDLVDPDAQVDPAMFGDTTNTHIPQHETDDWLKDMGRRKRRLMLDAMFPRGG